MIFFIINLISINVMSSMYSSKYLFILLIITISFFTSCKKQVHEIRPLSRSSNDSIITYYGEELPTLPIDESTAKIINVPEKTKNINADSIISGCDYILLETKNECLIGEIYKLDFDSTFIFILDRNNGNLFQFYDNGKFCRKIGVKGNGPDEYIELFNFTLDKSRKEISLIDMRKKKIFYYNYVGELIRKESMYYHFYDMEFIDDKIVAYTGTANNANAEIVQNKRIIISDRSQKPIYGAFPYSNKYKENVIFGIRRPLKHMNNKIYYTNFLSDIVWEISDTICNAAYRLIMDNANFLTDSELSNIGEQELANLRKSKRNFYGEFLVTNMYSIFMIDHYGGVVPLICNNKTNKIHYGQIVSNKPKKNIDSILGYNFNFIHTDSSFVQVVQPFLLKHYIESSQGLILDKESRELLDKINEEDNPILKIIKLRTS